MATRTTRKIKLPDGTLLLREKPEAKYPFPKFELLDKLPWLSDVSIWSAPPSEKRADDRDAFLLGGGGHLSARIGVRDRVSTMERIMAPYLSSYNFGENVNFRMDVVRPSRDFYPQFEFRPSSNHVWRVKDTAIHITAERDNTFELVTVSGIHPILHVYLRYASLRNISKDEVKDIGISFQAPPDVPYPVMGHQSVIMPLNNHELSERVQEMLPTERDFSQHYSNNEQRLRFMVRGLCGGKRRGYEDLFIHRDILAAGEAMDALEYLAPGISDTEASAIESAQLVGHHIEVAGIHPLFEQIRDWWAGGKADEASFSSSEPQFSELLDNNEILMRSVERATGGFVVIDDYSGSWMRDHNGPHRFLLGLGSYESIRRSMDRYYGLDVSAKALYSYYASDVEPYSPLPDPPDWEHVEGFVTGDVPNFRALWYWWYFRHTGDLNYVASRFEYMKGAFLRQKLHDNDWLADYCFDETYGIGPIGPMRTGKSADNSFIALAASRVLTEFAKLLNRDDVGFFEGYTQHIAETIESTFWLEKQGYYAMRRKPDGELDTTPFSIGLLRPLWAGSDVLSEEEFNHAARSAIYTFNKLYRKNGFLRLIPSHDQTVTMAIGYLLNAMKQIGHPEIDRVIADLPKWADPSGTFGEYLDEHADGPFQCYEHMAHRNRMWESGLNVDALFRTLTGFNPDAYHNKLSLEPYLPKTWKRFETNNLRFNDHRITLISERAGRITRHSISSTSSTPSTLSLRLRIPEEKTRLKLNGAKASPIITANPFGWPLATFELQLSSENPIVLEF